LEVILHYSPDCPRQVTGDAGRIRQILLNLAGNAIKFTEQGHALIEVSCRGHRGKQALIHIAVQDTGIGISPQVQEKLFQSFTQADASTTRRYGGTGLGLAISKQLVELMGGEISVKSTLGKGSCFQFTIPLPPGEMPEPLPQADLHNVRVLIVDDNRINRRILLEHLHHFGMRAEAAENAEQALARLRAAADSDTPFQLLLLDYLMPDMDGEQLAKAIRTDAAFAHVSLVVLTSVARKGDGQRFQAAGFVAYLTKPVLSETLRQTLAGVLGLEQQGGSGTLLITRHSMVKSNKQAAAKSSRFAAARVLLAEDIPANQKVACAMLKKLGIHTDIAANGREAVEQWMRCCYDLIFMDCQMPEMDGYEATRTIRAKEKKFGVHIPIIALTANALASERQRCLDTGMDDYIAKPLERDKLASILNEWLAPGERTVYKPAAKATTVTATCGGEAIDKTKFNALRKAMGEEDFAELVPVYIEGAEAMLEGLPQAYQASDFKELERLVHSLKSSSLNVGALPLAAMAREWEERIKTDEISDAPKHIAALQTEFQRVQKTLAMNYETTKHAKNAKK
ncbi:MAG: response regulator, partial [Gammaproteobacteria bacterium]|nr:response regulator [Gammaproteobacteria bacterium]